MTSSPLTDTIDILATISAGTGAITSLPVFYLTSILAFILSFGIRLGYEHRLETYLARIRDKVRR